ncbi:flagellar M-ring protein FliF [Alkalithermobacter thermoalcaliphilus JW-YL-7 = DSM 7308]|uniref:Flagellar M-ring protein n=1 Tax=Alkalithermobacter thermoalcaliphilus JW-YL-7 = DSM 7308 TaxID=1121328 RepID=A0A150FQ82_CLOPD|nr:flagellar M-ring protein FliF [[Clostridium] paradoxum JW-YL-7 = DSM 7308]SHK61552.1 flagellar M-ring protein FliF [[Clostridium] paradoxum JW-YL-7 = DSM 7308]
MGNYFQNVKEQLSKFFSSYDNRQKKIMIITAVLTLFLTTGIILYISRPEYVILYKDLDLKETGEIVKNLDDLRVQYKIKDQGTILVPKKDVNKIKIDLATKGVPAAKFSYEDIINKNTMFMSEDEKQKAYNYALQNHLASIIQEIPGVKKAIVTLSIPRRTEFILSENRQEAKASVFIEADNIDQISVDGIAVLVSNSVEGLNKENVTIHDSKGRVLNNSNKDNNLLTSTTQIELQNEVKSDIEKNLTEFLSSVFGYGNVSVMASVTLNFDTDIMESREFKTPIEGEENGLIRSMEENIETVSDNSAQGVPGTDTNTEEITQYVETDDNNSSYYKSNKIVNYELNEVIRKVEKAKGEVRDITVAVILNKDVLEGNELTEENRQQIEQLISSATGLQTKSVNIYAQSFNNNIQEALNNASSSKEGSLPLWVMVMLVVLLIIPIGALILYFTKKNRKDIKKEQIQIQIPEEKVEDLELDIKESGYKKSVESFINKNPEIVSQLLKSWLDED